MHAFYLATGLFQFTLNLVYPIIIGFGIFPFLGLYDNSWSNYFQFIKISFIATTAGCSAGIMWGTIFDKEMESLISSLVLILMFCLGSGKFVNLTNKSVIIKIFAIISPMKYSTELILRTVLKGRED